MAKNGCYSTNCLKNALNFFNLIFLFAAVGLLSVTIWILNRHNELINLLTSINYSVLINVLLISGALLFISSISGCFAVMKENRRGLIIYIYLLLFIILLELMVALVGYIYKENVNDDLKINLNGTMLENYGIDEDKTYSIDVIQQEFACCGAVQFEDWQFSIWKLKNMTNNKVPDSCCITVSEECGVRDHPSNIYYDACLDKIEMHMRNSLIILISVGLLVGALQMIGIILGIQLYLTLKDDIDINELRRILHNT